jgi:hypothetical protein
MYEGFGIYRGTSNSCGIESDVLICGAEGIGRVGNAAQKPSAKAHREIRLVFGALQRSPR